MPKVKKHARTLATSDVFDRIILYEDGVLSPEETVGLFQDLVDSGLISGLQGHYHRRCRTLMEAGLVSLPTGD